MGSKRLHDTYLLPTAEDQCEPTESDQHRGGWFRHGSQTEARYGRACSILPGKADVGDGRVAGESLATDGAAIDKPLGSPLSSCGVEFDRHRDGPAEVSFAHVRSCGSRAIECFNFRIIPIQHPWRSIIRAREKIPRVITVCKAEAQPGTRAKTYSRQGDGGGEIVNISGNWRERKKGTVVICTESAASNGPVGFPVRGCRPGVAAGGVIRSGSIEIDCARAAEGFVINIIHRRLGRTDSQDKASEGGYYGEGSCFWGGVHCCGI